MKNLILLLLFSNFLISNAQNNIFTEQNKLSFKESESYKTVTFHVGNLETQHEIDKLINLLKSNSDVFNVAIDNQTMICTIECKIKMDKATIVGITGPNGYKTSEYEEQIHLLVQMPNISTEDRARMQAERDNDNLLLINSSNAYPKFKNTGNPESDNADFAKRKKEWIKNNPEKYKLMIVEMPLSEEEKLEIIKKSK